MRCLKERVAYLMENRNNATKDIESYVKEYERQKKLENIVNSRVLCRPKVRIYHLVICYFMLLLLLCLIVLCYVWCSIDLWKKLILAFLSTVVLAESFFRGCLILTVKCYQHYAKEETRRRCQCIPSCSEYAIMTLKITFPLLLAIGKILKRLFRTCNGQEYVIDFPTKKMNKNYEDTIK